MDLCLIIMAVLVLIYIYKYKLEGYINVFPYYCQDCNKSEPNQCLKCYNCGYVVDETGGKCVEGDIYGPADKKYYCPSKNYVWHHNDPASTLLFGLEKPYQE